MVELLQGLGLLLRIFMPVVGAFDALDRMAKDALRDMRGLSNQRPRFSRRQRSIETITQSINAPLPPTQSHRCQNNTACSCARHPETRRKDARRTDQKSSPPGRPASTSTRRETLILKERT